MHRTYRRLDEPPKLAGFSLLQWLALLTLGGAVGGVLHLLGVATQPAISIFTLLVGAPAGLMYFSETGRPSLLRLARDCIRWRFRARVYEPGTRHGQPVTVLPPVSARDRRRQRSRAESAAGVDGR